MATLVYSLDANNVASYPGSGSSWFDVSGNTYSTSPTMSLVNGPAFVNAGAYKYLQFTQAAAQYGQFAMAAVAAGAYPSTTLAYQIYQQSFSIAMWVRLDSPAYGGQASPLLLPQTLTAMQYRVFVGGDTLQFGIGAGALGNSYGTNQFTASWNNFPTDAATTTGVVGGPGYPITPGDWQHIVATYEKTGANYGRIKFYVNGILRCQISKTTGPGFGVTTFDGSNALAIYLNRTYFLETGFYGVYYGDTSVNSYQIYQGDLSASEVYNLFRASAAPFGYSLMATLSPLPKMQFFSTAGVPLVGGKLYTYAAGTTTPLATYTSQSGATANTNPIILDSRGEANVWLSSAAYKLKLTTPADVEIWTVDNVGSGDQFGTSQLLTGVSGSDTISAFVTSPNFTAYAAGQTFNFVAAGTNATTSVTLNLNGLGAKSVTKEGTLALAAGDIQSGQMVQVVYDGTRFQIINAVYLSAPPPIGDVTPNTGAFTTLVAPTVNGDTRFNGNVGMGVAASASYRLNLLAAAGDNGAYISTPELVPAYFVSTDASATGMSVYYYKESATPTANDDMVNLRMFGNNSALALTEYGRIGSDAPSVASGAEDGRMVFRVMVNGTLTTAMVLDGSSSIDYGLGIGTTSPNGRLHVVDAVNRTEATAQFSIGGNGYTAAHFLDATAYKIKHSSGSRSIQVIADTNGVSLAPGTTSWAAISDEREKDIIEPISNALMKLADIRTVIGKYKTDPEDTRRSFLIAQDIQAVLPEAVSESDGVLSLRYAEVIPLLLAAIKELTTRVAVLEINAGP